MKNTLQILNDKEIVSLLLKRDERAIDFLYHRYATPILGLVYKIVKHQDYSEIVLQDTILKVWNKIDSFCQKKGCFFTWLMNIARNTAIDMLRSKNYKQMLALINLETLASKKQDHSVYSVDTTIENLDVRSFVSKLDRKSQEVIELVYFQGYTGPEVSRELGIPLGTVKSRIRKGFKDLRVFFKE